MSSRTYSELITFLSFDERFEYLRLDGSVAEVTFGFERYLNQTIYKGYAWRKVRDKVIVRDGACDLGLNGFEITGTIFIHHLNPIRISDLIDEDPRVFNLENLICTSLRTHQAIHLGDKRLLEPQIITRSPGDTKLW